MAPSWAMRWKFPIKAEGEDRYLIEQLVSILLSYYASGCLLEPPSLNGWLHWFLSLTITGAAGSQGSGLSFWILRAPSVPGAVLGYSVARADTVTSPGTLAHTGATGGADLAWDHRPPRGDDI